MPSKITKNLLSLARWASVLLHLPFYWLIFITVNPLAGHTGWDTSLWNYLHFLRAFDPRWSAASLSTSRTSSTKIQTLSKNLLKSLLGFPGGTSGKEPACQCRRHKRRGFDPWVGKNTWRRAWTLLSYSCLENLIGRAAWGLQFIGSQRVEYNWSD